jgi:hypothetical protein
VFVSVRNIFINSFNAGSPFRGENTTEDPRDDRSSIDFKGELHSFPSETLFLRV